jgi:hypothetical protein
MTVWSAHVWVDPLVLASMITTLGGGIWSVRKMVKNVSRELSSFQQDWHGTPPRPGVPGRKGVMERLQDQDEQLQGISHELSFNSGLSVKDAVYRIERKLNL